MAYSSEIEKLRARYNENPKGRNFAPLADAYRKAKQLDEAIALCREGLTHHPDYVSAHIVLGRCLVDKGDDEGAEGAFRRVLELDGENIIALKLLSDIAVRTGRPAEAVDWLTHLLQVDPMNGEAADLLASARGHLAGAAEEPAPLAATLTEMPAAHVPGASPDAPTKPMTAHGAPALAPREAVAEAELELEVAGGVAEEAGAAEAARAELGGEIESYDGSIDFSGVEGGAARASGVRDELERAPDGAMPVPNLARSQYEGSGMFKLDAPDAGDQPAAADAGPAAEAAEPAPSESDDAPSDLPLILPDEVAAEQRPTGQRRTPTPARRAGGDERPVQPLLAFPDDEGAADQAALSAAPPLVTETMAELYLRQGHLDEALRVYRALLERRPDDARLRAKIDSLAAPRSAAGGAAATEAARPTAVEFLQSVFGGERAAPPVGVARAAGDGEPGETMLDQAFAEPAAEAAPPAAPPADAVRGAPTRPADDALSLDQVFGEGQEGAPSAPEVEKGAAVGARASFSFDDFFHSAEPPQAPGAQESPSAPSTGRAPRASEADQDLDQFQAWLRSLKS